MAEGIAFRLIEKRFLHFFLAFTTAKKSKRLYLAFWRENAKAPLGGDKRDNGLLTDLLHWWVDGAVSSYFHKSSW